MIDDPHDPLHRLLDDIQKSREEAFYAGFTHGMSVQKKIYHEQYPEMFEHQIGLLDSETERKVGILLDSARRAGLLDDE